MKNIILISNLLARIFLLATGKPGEENESIQRPVENDELFDHLFI